MISNGLTKKVIALEARLRHCRNVTTLGARPNFSAYSEDQREMIRCAQRIYYPTALYADVFAAQAKPIFPSHANYRFAQDKIKQTVLFETLEIPHPRTRVFYGKRQKASICEYFRFPFIAKDARGSALGRGVYLITDHQALQAYCEKNAPAYIQQYLPADRDIRVVIIGTRIVHAYFRVASLGEFRTNLAQGAHILLDNVPAEALDLALHTARVCGWNDVGIDILPYQGKYYVLEANMKYGREGFREAGLDYFAIMENLIENGKI